MWDKEQTGKAYKKLMDYLNRYPDSKITPFNSNYGSIFDKYFCLECDQSYDDLDLDCNSMFDGSLIRLARKPNYLEHGFKSFEDLYHIYVND
jgi:hypothetical protein